MFYACKVNVVELGFKDFKTSRCNSIASISKDKDSPLNIILKAPVDGIASNKGRSRGLFLDESESFLMRCVTLMIGLCHGSGLVFNRVHYAI